MSVIARCRVCRALAAGMLTCTGRSFSPATRAFLMSAGTVIVALNAQSLPTRAAVAASEHQQVLTSIAPCSRIT